MALFVEGEQIEPRADPHEWPYQTVADAIKDGWRVVRFPELALLLNETRNYGLGCEFVLEKEGLQVERLSLDGV